MSKTSSILAVFALILAGTAIGLQAYNLLIVDPAVKNSHGISMT